MNLNSTNEVRQTECETEACYYSRCSCWLSGFSRQLRSDRSKVIYGMQAAHRCRMPRCKVKNEQTNVTQDGKSDNAGLYQFLDLAPGVYSISAETAGFRQALVKSVSVLVDQIVSVDIKLEVGQITEVVIVDGGVTAVIEPEKSSTGTNFDPKLTANLPLTNRRFNDLALLTPGASFAAAGTQAGGFAAAGSRAQSTNWMIDGINDLDPQVNGANTNFRIAEAVQELSVVTTVPSVEFGRQSGAQVNVVTKSGTNLFHGSLFEFNRNDKLQATDFFTNKLGGTKNPLHRNQYGASIGGPIRKNKTFFFYSWEALQQSNPDSHDRGCAHGRATGIGYRPDRQEPPAVFPFADGSHAGGRKDELRRQLRAELERQYASRADRPHAQR